MDQTHIGYTFWNEPPVNAMPAVTEVHPLAGPHMAVAVQGSPFAVNGPFPPLALPAFDGFDRHAESPDRLGSTGWVGETRWIDVSNRGDQPFQFTATADRPWIRLDSTSGTVNKEQRLHVTIDWDQATQAGNSGAIVIQQKDGPAVTVRMVSAPLQER